MASAPRTRRILLGAFLVAVAVVFALKVSGVAWWIPDTVGIAGALSFAAVGFVSARRENRR
jgi:hypothetical protein